MINYHIHIYIFGSFFLSISFYIPGLKKKPKVTAQLIHMKIVSRLYF